MATNPLLEAAQRRDALVAQIPTGGQRQAPAADGSQSNPLNNDLGRNLSALPSAGGIPGAALRGTGLVARAFGASQPAMSGLGQAAQAAAPYAPVAAGGAALASAANADSPATPRAPAVPSMASNPFVQAASASSSQAAPAAPGSSPAPAAPAAPNSAVTRTGNSYSGTNVSGDITINGQAPRNGGGISAQNEQAAQNLSGRRGLASYANEPPPVMGQNRIPLIEAAGIRHSGNDWAARKNLENLATGASSIMNRGDYADAGMGRFGGGQGGVPPAVAAYQAALQTDQALQQAVPGLQAEGMRQSNALVRAAMEQQGQNQRAGMQAGLQQQRLDMDRETQGYANRRMGLVEYMRNQVAQEQDPTKRRGLVQYMRDVEGAQTPSDWDVKVTPTTKNLDGSTSMGSVIRHNRATGQVEQVPMGQGGQPASGYAPTSEAVALLKSNPGMARQFDEFYGAGAAQRAMGGQR